MVCNFPPNFVLDGQPLQFVSEFRYLGLHVGQIVTNSLCDDADIHREIHCITEPIHLFAFLASAPGRLK